MLLKCSKCGNEISIGASYCPKCGDKEPFKGIDIGAEYKKLSLSEKQNFVKLGGKRKFSAFEKFIILPILALFFIMIVYSPLKPKSPEEIAQEKIAVIEDEKKHNKSLAWYYCEEELKNRLRDPDSFEANRHIVLEGKDMTFDVAEDYRAKNGFGGYNNALLQCRVKLYKDGYKILYFKAG